MAYCKTLRNRAGKVSRGKTRKTHTAV
jgi:hypothetical protein